MNLRGRRRWLVVISVFLLLIGGWFIVFPSALRVNYVSRITVGLTRDEVMAAIGRGPDHFGSGFDHWYVWDGAIMVCYDSDDHAINTSICNLAILRWQISVLTARFGYRWQMLNWTAMPANPSARCGVGRPAHSAE